MGWFVVKIYEAIVYVYVYDDNEGGCVFVFLF